MGVDLFPWLPPSGELASHGEKKIHSTCEQSSIILTSFWYSNSKSRIERSFQRRHKRCWQPSRVFFVSFILWHLVTYSQCCLLSFPLQTNIMTLDPLHTVKGWSPGPPAISRRISLDMELRWALCGVVSVALMVTGEWNTLITVTLVSSHRFIHLACYWRVLLVRSPSLTSFNSSLHREQRTGEWWVIPPSVKVINFTVIYQILNLFSSYWENTLYFKYFLDVVFSHFYTCYCSTTCVHWVKQNLAEHWVITSIDAEAGRHCEVNRRTEELPSQPVSFSTECGAAFGPRARRWTCLFLTFPSAGGFLHCLQMFSHSPFDWSQSSSFLKSRRCIWSVSSRFLRCFSGALSVSKVVTL